MKIAYFTSNRTTFPPEKKQIAASTTVTLSLIHQLKQRHEITLYAAQGSRIDGVRVIDLALPPFHMDSALADSDWATKYALGMKQIYLGALLSDAHQYDIIHLQTEPVYLGFSYAKLVKTPLLFTSHNMFHDFEKNLFAFYNNKVNLSVLSYRQAELIPMSSLPVIHNGIETLAFSFNQKSKEYYLFLGRLTEDKGVREYLQLADDMPEEEFYIAGKGNEQNEKKIVEFCATHQNTRFLGMLEYQSSAWFEALSYAKALIMPITYEDPCPLVPLESMACGTPVIAFEKGALPEQIVNGKTGFIVKPQDGVMGLQNAIHTLKSFSDSEYDGMRRDSRNHVEHNFNVKTMAIEYEKLYQSLLQ